MPGSRQPKFLGKASLVQSLSLPRQIPRQYPRPHLGKEKNVNYPGKGKKKGTKEPLPGDQQERHIPSVKDRR